MITQFETVQQFMDDNRAWTDTVFPTATAISCLNHLRKEVDETIAAIIDEDHTIDFSKRRAVVDEYADIYLLLLNSCSRYGLSFDELQKAAESKMQKNRQRQWGKPNEQGFTEHLK